ncbi:hypothetical protein AJ78_04526 [Emergomyces pasteurianus Ep9510]|uniref:Uncharacterized protein n=1 Tax=Emergomyces pasteurianus Ep9510 TaxID=1447872 RepID=A0A1J9Q4R3_9EURO|nr:hypothetical protein AJ78_04526 [Emergomyces pasteurianus Ep9510]
MEVILEDPTKGDATTKVANGSKTTTIPTTTKTTLPVTTPILNSNQLADFHSSASPPPSTSTSSNFPALLSALLTPLQTTIQNHLPDSFTSRLPPLSEAYIAHLSAHPHLTTFVTIQLLFASLPLLLFALFTAGTLLFSLVLALLGAVALSALVIGGVMLVLVIPVTVAGAVVAGMMWIGCWVGWYGVVCAGVVFGKFGGSQHPPERRNRGMRWSEDDQVGGMGKWEGKWEEWRKREREREKGATGKEEWGMNGGGG